jgi:hypothetical protein
LELGHLRRSRALGAGPEAQNAGRSGPFDQEERGSGNKSDLNF